MAEKFTKLTITWDQPVDIPSESFRIIGEEAQRICKAWEKDNPTQIMWAAHHGAEIASMQGDNITYVPGALHIGCVSRDRSLSEPSPDEQRRLNLRRAQMRALSDMFFELTGEMPEDKTPDQIRGVIERLRPNPGGNNGK